MLYIIDKTKKLGKLGYSGKRIAGKLTHHLSLINATRRSDSFDSFPVFHFFNELSALRGEGKLSSAYIMRTRGFLRMMRTSALFGAKTKDFSKFMMCPHGQGARGGQFFAVLCGHLMDGP